MKTRFIILWAGILYSLTACQVSKDLALPAPQLPANLSAAVSDSISIADVPWKEFFTDARLQELIDSAVNRNYDMMVAVKNIEAAGQVLKQVKWNNIPTLGVNITASTQRPSDNSLTGLSLDAFGVQANHIEDYSANLALSWEADVWGKIRNQKKSALAAYLQSREAKRAVQTAVVSGVAQGYYNLLMLNAQLRIAQQNVSLNDSTVSMIRLQFESGKVTSLAMEQAEAQRLAASELIPELKMNISLQEHALSILTGRLPDHIQRISNLEQLTIPKDIATGIPASLLNRRPDVKAKELALTAANARVGISQAEMYPALRLSASGGLNSFRASDWFNIPGSLFGVVGASIFQPLLQHRQLKTQLETARIEREKVVLQFRQSVLTAVGEVSDALTKVEQTSERETIARERVTTTRRGTESARQLFASGLATYLEVINAQGNALQSELNLAAARRSQISAVTELYIALGGGWK
ncbi:efflux transporter outer membrane subunit [Mucilaginibacter lappiensis]|uniref:efflux transporter outer membrane subunit n=1 Tax=Mucilaginibacter lappiensis TaxID=354630 RepID=UPI003D1E0A27